MLSRSPELAIDSQSVNDVNTEWKFSDLGVWKEGIEN